MTSQTERRLHSQAKERHSLLHVCPYMHTHTQRCGTVHVHVYAPHYTVQEPMRGILLHLNEGALRFVTSRARSICTESALASLQCRNETQITETQCG